MAAGRISLLDQLRTEYGNKLKLGKDINGRVVATVEGQEEKYDIFGVEVAKEYFDKFKERKFNVLDKKDVSLSVLKIYATSEDYKENAPEYTEAAGKLIEEIKREVLLDFPQVKKPSKEKEHILFSSHITDLKYLFEYAVEKVDELNKSLEKAEASYQNCEKAIEKLKLQAIFLEAKEKYKEEMINLKEEVKSCIKEIENEFETHLRDHYLPSGKNLDPELVSLLNSGIVLRSHEIDTIADAHKSNPTMLRLISDYTKNKKIEVNNYSNMLFRLAEGHGKEERKTFSGGAKVILDVVGEDASKAKQRIQMKEEFLNLFDRDGASLDNYILSPAENAE